MNNTLFASIAVLLVSIVGLGIAELRIQSHETALASSQTPSQAGLVDVTQQPEATTVAGSVGQAVEKVEAAYTGNWSKSQDDDSDSDEDEGEDSDDDRESPVVQTQTQTKTQTGASKTGAQTAGSYTMAQVAAHNSASSCYTAINGSVYDLTSFVSQHPGGASRILSLCGIDGTAAYSSQHGSARRPANELASLKIGTLAQ